MYISETMSQRPSAWKIELKISKYPLCGSDASVTPYTDRDVAAVDCGVCGRFDIAGTSVDP
jgi:hypothetical protein